jgi:SAM-dependent methyltransferase
VTAYYEEYWQRGKEWSPSDGELSLQERELLAPHLRPGVICLDYGCGDGVRYGGFLQGLGVQFRGFDVSTEAVAKARSLGLHAELLTVDGKTSLPAESCDVAVCFEVFEHLLEPQLALAEIARVLCPTGVLLASVPNASHWFQRCEFLATGFFNPGGSPLTARRRPWSDPHIRFFSPKLFRRFLVENGFHRVEIIPSPFTLAWLPYIYRKARLRAFAEVVSKPFGWLSRVAPGLLAGRLFARAYLS